MKVNYKRVLLKLSGELLSNNRDTIDINRLLNYVHQIQALHAKGIEIGIVIGGGNIFRGINSKSLNINKEQVDYMGMLSTIINGLALQDLLNQKGLESILISKLQVEGITQQVPNNQMITYLSQKKILIFVGGLGNPFFTTDTAASIRALEIKAELILKATKVDGVYTEDPMKNTKAKRFDQISFQECYEKKLNVLDLTAITLCREHRLPIMVFKMDINQSNQLVDVIEARAPSTLIC